MPDCVRDGISDNSLLGITFACLGVWCLTDRETQSMLTGGDGRLQQFVT